MSKWDNYFLALCKVVASNSECLSRQIGAVLTRDKTVISTGYNGPPRGVPHCGERPINDQKLRTAMFNMTGESGKFGIDKCPRQIMGFESGEGLEWCVAGHSERNCLISAARNGISTKDSVLYMDCGVPCSPCLVEIINAGVAEIVVTKLEYYDISAEYLLNNSSLKVRVYELEGV